MIQANCIDPMPHAETPMLTTTELDMLFEELPSEIYHCLGQLSYYDRLIYYWAGRSFYTGFGTIVDAGALIGGTAKLMAYGLTQNTKVSDTARCILSYDRFEDDEGGFMVSAVGSWPGVELPPACSGKVDFEPAFRKNTQDFAASIEVRRGDITKVGYRDDRPIEVMSVDVGKTPELMAYVAQEFFPRLIPNRSIVLNQDYLFQFQPWVIMAMELLSDCFALEYAPPTECTTVHRCIRPISAEMVTSRLEGYWAPDRLFLIERAARALSSPMNQLTLRAAQIYGMWRLGKHIAAQEAARQMLAQFMLTGDAIRKKPGFERLFNEIGVPL